MNDYTNYMSVSNTPTYLKIIFFVLIASNFFFYKKYKLSRYIEESFSSYIMTYASLAFLLASLFPFMTANKDTYLEVLSIVLGIGISLSYMYNTYQDASTKKIGLKWLIIIGVLIVDSIGFSLIPDKTIAYILCLLQTLLAMIYETNKKELNT